MDAWMDGPVRSLLWLIHSIKTLLIFFFFFFFGAWSLFQQEIGSGSFTSAEFLPGSHFFLAEKLRSSPPDHNPDGGWYAELAGRADQKDAEETFPFQPLS